MIVTMNSGLVVSGDGISKGDHPIRRHRFVTLCLRKLKVSDVLRSRYLFPKRRARARAESRVDSRGRGVIDRIDLRSIEFVTSGGGFRIF